MDQASGNSMDNIKTDTAIGSHQTIREVGGNKPLFQQSNIYNIHVKSGLTPHSHKHGWKMVIFYLADKVVQDPWYLFAQQKV